MTERAVGHKGVHASLAQLNRKLLDTCATIAKYQPLLAMVQPRNDQGCIGQRPHIVQLDIWFDIVWRWRIDDATRGFALGTEPIDELLGVANSSGEANPLNILSSQVCYTRQDGQEVLASVVTGKGVQLIDDHSSEVGKKCPMLEASRHQHHLDGLRSR
jgi:hypothetical protein